MNHPKRNTSAQVAGLFSLLVFSACQAPGPRESAQNGTKEITEVAAEETWREPAPRKIQLDVPQAGIAQQEDAHASKPVTTSTAATAVATAPHLPDVSAVSGESPDPRILAQPLAAEQDRMDVSYAEFPAFGPAVGTTDTEWRELQAKALIFVDMSAGPNQPRAARYLEDAGYKSMPAILNELRNLDLGTMNGHQAGDIAQRTITVILNGRNFGWKSERTELGPPTDKAHTYNRKVVLMHLKTWQGLADDPAAWIPLAKLTKPAYADELRTYQATLTQAGIPFDR